MKKFLLIILCLTGSLQQTQAQELDQYKYVQVPQRFDFFSEDNQFQLNKLTAFLLEKYGFQVLYGEDLPDDLQACDLLKADVLKDKGIFITKLKLTLENCKGETVFTSKEGRSREKNYKAAYHEALRDAFTSFEELDYEYSEEVVYVTEPEDVMAEGTDAVEESVREKQVAEKAQPEVVESAVVNGSTIFRNGTTEYTLKPTASGYELFKSGDEKTFATLLKSGSGSNYIYASKNVQGSAYFDASGNLVVEYLDSASGQLLTVVYKLQG